MVPLCAKHAPPVEKTGQPASAVESNPIAISDLITLCPAEMER
jgi:hypothetical protein